MELTVADIKEFKRLYKRHFGVSLSNKEAQYKLRMLVKQLELVYQPITERQLFKFLEDKRKEEQSRGN